MPRSLAIFAALGFFSVMLLGLTWGLTLHLTPRERRRPLARWLLGWTVKGFFAPALLWTLMNFGLSFTLQPFDPAVQAAKLTGGNLWIPEFLRVSTDGWFIAATYWGALTLGWVLWLFVRDLEGEARTNFRTLALMSAVGMLLPAIGVIYFSGPAALGFAGLLMLAPMAIGAPNLVPKQADRPMYSRAIAKMKFGKYSEAEWEIIRQLERHEDDFDGWLMMAALYADHFKDLPEAEQTILEVCDQPRTTSSQISIALHKLADWHLKYSGDPEAAGRALQMICNRLPGTHLAHMAELRLRQLPKSREELFRQQHPEPIHLPPADCFTPDLRSSHWISNPEQAAQLANEQVAALQLDPNDAGAREKLARLLAEQLNQPEPALEQLALLLNMPDQPDLKRAEWLALTATWHLHYRHDEHTGRRALERLIQEFPESPQAFAARRRLQTP